MTSRSRRTAPAGSGGWGGCGNSASPPSPPRLPSRPGLLAPGRSGGFTLGPPGRLGPDPTELLAVRVLVLVGCLGVGFGGASPVLGGLGDLVVGLGGDGLVLVDAGLGDAGLDGRVGVAGRGRLGLHLVRFHLGLVLVAGDGGAGFDLGVGGDGRALLVQLVGGLVQVLAGQGGLGLAGGGAAAAQGGAPLGPVGALGGGLGPGAAAEATAAAPVLTGARTLAVALLDQLDQDHGGAVARPRAELA